MKATMTKPLLVLSVFLLGANVITAFAVDLDSAEQAYAKGQYSQAAIGYARVLQDQPHNLEVKTKLAASYHYQGQLEPAERLLNEVLDVDKNNMPALLELGQIRSQQQNWEAVQALYQRAIDAAPDNATAYLGLGNALMQLGDESSADAAFAAYQTLTGDQK